MLKPSTPADESRRLLALWSTQLLDTAEEPRFDRLTGLVKQCLGTEIVLISLVDEQRQWFKSRQGLEACETHREISFCGHAILADGLFIVEDASEDWRFADNPLVTEAPHIRFYSGAPLHYEGFPIGTLCLIDSKPRLLSQAERGILRQFADAVEQEIVDRLEQFAQQQLAESELLYRSVLDGTRIATWQWNVQTGQTRYNERWAEMVGYTLAELEPISIDTWHQLIHPDDAAKAERLLQQHFSGELLYYDCKFRMRHKQGQWIWVHDRGRLVSWTEQGAPLMMYGTHADITKEELAEQALRESRDQLRTLVATIPGVTYRRQADCAVAMQFISDGIEPLSGYPASEFIRPGGRRYKDLIHAEDAEWVQGQIRQAVSEGRSWRLQYRLVHRDGHSYWVEERGMADSQDDDSANVLNGFILNISKEKELNDRLSKLSRQLPGVIYQYQQWPDGRSAFPYASESIKQIYNVTPEQVQFDASPVLEVIYPPDMPALQASVDRSMATLELWTHEYRVVKPDGRLAWMSGRAMPESGPDGSVLWHGYIDDITEKKHYYIALEHANDDLQMAQQRLELSSKQAQLGYWRASLKTGELWWSEMIFSIFGFDPKTTVPSIALFDSTVHPDDRSKIAESEAKARETGEHNVIHRIIRPDGEVRWVHELAQMLPESENPDLILIGSVQDVTHAMKLQQLKDEFISTVSHELRTPLTSIGGAIKLLLGTQADQLNDTMRHLLGIANSNTHRLQHLINDLLDIEKLTAGKMVLEYRDLPLAAALEKALSDHTTFAEKSRVQLALVVTPEAEQAQIHVDEHRLQQILANLLSNALKFSPDGGVVQLEAHCVGASVEIAVQDAGPGLPLAFRDKVFQRFAQADASSSKAKGGTGLGLALCKELTEVMGGQIGYESKPGCGARFYVRFPVCLGQTSA